MNGNVVVCDGDAVTTAFYRYRIDLKAAASGSAAEPTPGEITRPTPPFNACRIED